MTALYVLAQELVALEEMLLMDGGELTEAHQELAEQLDRIITEKIDNIGELVQKFKDEQDTAKAHESRIREWRKVRENAESRLKKYVHEVVEKIPSRKIQGSLYSASLRSGVESVVIEDENLIPEQFLKIETTIDKAGLKAALKNGEAIEGARLQRGNPSLMLKMKAVK